MAVRPFLPEEEQCSKGLNVGERIKQGPSPWPSRTAALIGLVALLGLVAQWRGSAPAEAQTPSPVVVALAGPESAVVAGQPTTFGYSAATIDSAASSAAS